MPYILQKGKTNTEAFEFLLPVVSQLAADLQTTSNWSYSKLSEDRHQALKPLIAIIRKPRCLFCLFLHSLCDRNSLATVSQGSGQPPFSSCCMPYTLYACPPPPPPHLSPLSRTSDLVFMPYMRHLPQGMPEGASSAQRQQHTVHDSCREQSCDWQQTSNRKQIKIDRNSITKRKARPQRQSRRGCLPRAGIVIRLHSGSICCWVVQIFFWTCLFRIFLMALCSWIKATHKRFRQSHCLCREFRSKF